MWPGNLEEEIRVGVRRRGVVFVIIAATLLATTGVGTVQAAPPSTSVSLDQSFTTPNNLSTFINECCAYIGQTFTAGRTGRLLGVNIDVTGFGTSLPLHVAIRAVDPSGLPNSTVLGETVLDSSSSPLTRLITFPQDIRVTAGTQYAIVVNYQGAPPEGAGAALGGWAGAVGDIYRRGSAVFSFDYGASWSSYASEGFDLHFQTNVESLPTSRDQCKNGGYRAFNFKNQGQCVAFVQRGPGPKGST
jgi:hypothetical protein